MEIAPDSTISGYFFSVFRKAWKIYSTIVTNQECVLRFFVIQTIKNLLVGHDFFLAASSDFFLSSESMYLKF